MTSILGTGSFRYEVAGDWGRLPDGWDFGDVAAVAVDRQDRVYVFNRGEHPMIVFDREGNFLRSWGEGLFAPRARPAHRPGRASLLHRRRRPHGAQVHARRQGAAHHRHSGQARALHERRAVPSLHAHRALAAGRHLRLGRLRQRARAQVLARRQAARVLGRAGLRSGPVQHPAQHLQRRGRLGLRRRPREPPRAGLRRQRQVRDAVEQPASSVRAVRWSPARSRCATSARSVRRMPINREVPEPRPAHQHRDARGQAARPPRRRSRRHAPDQFIAPHGLAVDSRGDLYVGEVSYTAWPQIYPDTQPPAGLRSLRKLVRVEA